MIIPPAVVPNSACYRETEILHYGEPGNDFQTCYLTIPRECPSPAPVTVWFHGGGLTGDGAQDCLPALYNGKNIVVEVRYRLSPATPATGAIEDAAAALARIISGIDSWGGDRRRLFIGGISAGAYLAAIVGTNPRFLAPYGIDPRRELAGLMLVSGQMTTHYQLKIDLGYPGNQFTPVIDDYAPLAHASADLPPIVLVTGAPGLDIAGRPEENAFFAATLRALGHRHVEHYALPGHDHSGAFASCNFLLERFLEKILAERQ